MITIAALAMTQNDTSENSYVLYHPASAIPIGAFLGRLPDMIEPALGNPNHRISSIASRHSVCWLPECTKSIVGNRGMNSRK